MKRYELTIQRASGKEYKYFRANNIGSLVGMARDMMKDDITIAQIKIIDTITDEVEIVK